MAERTRELEQLSRQDPLTGLYNQRFFMETLRGELARAQRADTPLALLYFDIDNFKQINDQTGHLAGDEALRSISNALLAESRPYDVCCRYGGDEFCVLLPGTDARGAQLFAERLLKHLAKTKLAASPSPSLSIGIGIGIGIAQNGPQIWLNALQFINCAD